MFLFSYNLSGIIIFPHVAQNVSITAVYNTFTDVPRSENHTMTHFKWIV
jgi:hypothetical protein